jgi:hypothetical protein
MATYGMPGLVEEIPISGSGGQQSCFLQKELRCETTKVIDFALLGFRYVKQQLLLLKHQIGGEECTLWS